MDKTNYEFKNLDEIKDFFYKYKPEVETSAEQLDVIAWKEAIIKEFTETHQNKLMEAYNNWLKLNIGMVAYGDIIDVDFIKKHAKWYIKEHYIPAGVADLGTFDNDYFYWLFKDHKNLWELFWNDHGNELNKLANKRIKK